MDDVYVKIYDMPCGIRSYVVLDSDNSYTVIINAKLSSSAQLDAYQHEIDHIRDGDCSKRTSADIIEFYAHSRAVRTSES